MAANIAEGEEKEKALLAHSVPASAMAQLFFYGLLS
jgi:hypothetical protein